MIIGGLKLDKGRLSCCYAAPAPLCYFKHTRQKKELEETRQKEEDRVVEQKHQDTEKLLP